jgi:hypothetical protein
MTPAVGSTFPVRVSLLVRAGRFGVGRSGSRPFLSVLPQAAGASAPPIYKRAISTRKCASNQDSWLTRGKVGGQRHQILFVQFRDNTNH